MKVKFKKLRDNAKLPTKVHDSDFCYDVYACDRIQVAPNVYKYPLGFALEIDDTDGIQIRGGSRPLRLYNFIPKIIIPSIDFRPRSSIYKTGMVLANSCGTVDYSYRGEVSAFFYHVIPGMPIYEPGDRVAQMKIGFTVPIEFEEVDELSKTDRGDGGFGSTGRK